MVLPEMKSCFGGCNLQSGALIVLWLYVIIENFAISASFAFRFWYGAAGCAVVFFFMICGLYAIKQKKPSFLIPGVILFHLSAFAMMIMVFYFAFVFGRGILIRHVPFTVMNCLKLVGKEIATIIGIFLQFYMATVLYSYYKHMKDDAYAEI